MIPRFEVKELYPFSPYKVGDIITTGVNSTLYRMFKQFPNVFSEKEWWERMEESEMPRYVKYASDGVAKKVTQWDMETSSPWFMYIEGDGRPYCPGGSSLENTHWLPATEAEYQFQLSKEEKK